MLPARVAAEVGMKGSVAIHVAAVTNRRHIDKAVLIVDLVQHAVVSDPDAPEVVVAFQFLATWGPRGFGKSFDSWKDPIDHRQWKLLEFLASGPGERDRVVRH
jgi:hypothetical protein